MVLHWSIGIPIYFTDLQSRPVLDAATIAGLHPLRLMHETSTTALAYGIYKTDLPENEQLNVAFFDIGCLQRPSSGLVHFSVDLQYADVCELQAPTKISNYTVKLLFVWYLFLSIGIKFLCSNFYLGNNEQIGPFQATKRGT